MTRPVSVGEIIELLPRIAVVIAEAVELSCIGFLRVKFGIIRGKVDISIGTVVEQYRHGGGMHVVQVILGRQMMKQGLVGFVGGGIRTREMRMSRLLRKMIGNGWGAR